MYIDSLDTVLCCLELVDERLLFSGARRGLKAGELPGPCGVLNTNCMYELKMVSEPCLSLTSLRSCTRFIMCAREENATRGTSARGGGREKGIRIER